jgi:hypothetical protein
MKTANLMPFLAVLVSAASALAADAPVRVSVTNPLDATRAGETVELRAGVLAPRFQPADLPRLSVTDARTAHEVLVQAVDENGDGTFDALVFQADFKAGETREFTLVRGDQRKPRLEDFRVYGRFVRERQDDFAWENDLVAFRVYGAALETFVQEPLTSSAVDAWVKSTRRLVLNDWYLVDDYHKDHGEGGDFYPAGKSRGCGGSGLMTPSGLAVSRNFRESRVLASGPIRLVFELSYPAWEKLPAVKETKRVTLDAGSHFNRFESVYTVEGSGPLAWAAGIRKAKDAAIRIDRERGFVRTWESLSHYADNGSLGCGILMDPAQITDVSEADGNELVAARTHAGKPAVFYAGTAWDRGGEIKDAEAWDRQLEAFARRLASPLRIEVVAP